jgi:hypothetical protein
MLFKPLLALSLLTLVHDSSHPELNEWLKSLTNQRNVSCCDGSDAFAIDQPDWDTNHESTSEEYPYKVFVRAPQVPQGEWVYVHKNAVVKQNNKHGIARVWPIFTLTQNGIYFISVSCFLPGTLS